MGVTFQQLLDQAEVKLAPNGLYLHKSNRNCESVARLMVAVRALIDSHNAEMLKSESEKTKLANEVSKQAAKNAVQAESLSKLSLDKVRIGLENNEHISEQERARLVG
jgi:hypothetical protein